MPMGTVPSGLYNPAYEHDSCGVAMVADMHGRRSRDIVDKAITALLNLEHRGAAGAEPNTGDGSPITTYNNNTRPTTTTTTP